MKPRVAVAASLLVFAMPLLAFADEASAKRAEQLFQESMDAQAKGRYAEACARLEESNRLERAVGTEYNLAACYELLKRPATALRLYRSAADLATSSGKSAIAARAKQRAAKLEGTVPRLTLRPAPSAKEATITLDGRPVDPTSRGVELEVDPGPHAIVASAEGRVPFETTIDLREGQRSEVVIALDPAEQKPPVTIDASPRPNGARDDRTDASSGSIHPLRLAGYATAGAGIVALGVAAYFTLSASSAKDDSGCRDGRFCPDEAAAERLRDAQSQGNLATAFALTGGVLTAAGVALVIFSPARTRVALSSSGSTVWISGAFQ